MKVLAQDLKTGKTDILEVPSPGTSDPLDWHKRQLIVVTYPVTQSV